MQFKQLELEDIPILKPYFLRHGSDICDYTIGGMFLWREFYKMEYAIEGDTCYSRVHNEQNTKILYNLPMGPDIRKGIARIIEIEKDNPAQLRFVTIEERFLPYFENQEVEFTHHNQDRYSDYVYLSSEFRNLSGKRNHKRRNHIQQFKRYCEDDWSFKEMTVEDVPAVKKFFEENYAVDPNANEEELEENKRAMEAVDRFADYDMFGGILYAKGEIVGFSISEIVGRTMFVHIEKAARRVPGVYQMLNHQFAEYFAQDVELINREDDAGDEGLRRSKMSYHPLDLFKKFVVEEVMADEA